MEAREVNKIDPQVGNFMKQHEISVEHTIELMGNYYPHNNPVTTWEKTAKEEFWVFKGEGRISVFSSHRH